MIWLQARPSMRVAWAPGSPRLSWKPGSPDCCVDRWLSGKCRSVAFCCARTTTGAGPGARVSAYKRSRGATRRSAPPAIGSPVHGSQANCSPDSHIEKQQPAMCERYLLSLERKGPRIAPRTLQLHPRHLPTWARQASAGPTGESNRRMSWIMRTWRFCSSAHSSASSRLVKGPTTGNSSPCGSRRAVRISAMSSTYPRIACPKSRHQPESLTGGLVGVVLAQSMTNRAETGRLLLACGLASGSLTQRRSIRRE